MMKNKADIKEYMVIREDVLKEIDKSLDRNRIVNVYGAGGVGKTSVLRTIGKHSISGEGDADSTLRDIKNFYYTEVSACVSDYEIYNNIVNVVEIKSNVEFTKFRIIYQWYIENRKLGFQKRKTDTSGDIPSILSDLFGFDIGSVSDDITLDSDDLTNKIISVLKNAEVIYSLIAKGINLFNLIKYLLDIGKKIKNQKIFKELLGIVEGCNSDFNYRNALRNCLIAEWKEIFNQENEINEQSLFIIDNYRLLYARELNYSSAWIEALSEGIGQYWIIGSRTEIKTTDERRIGKIKILGFNNEQANEYIEKQMKLELLRKNYNKNYEKKDKYDEFEKSLIQKILDVCETEPNKNTYLPYKLNLVVTFVNQRILNGEEITVNDVVGHSEASKFVNYYYFSHMSEMVIAAVQLLSCLPAWNEEMYNLLKSKFNYHYLEAEYLMHKSAFVEHSNGVIKLHETIRDAVYNSEDNYIVVDVNNYFYQELSKKILEEKSGHLLIDYFDIAENYLDRFKKKVEKEKKAYVNCVDLELSYNVELRNFKKILKAINSIYGKKENVTIEYAEKYCKILEVVYEKDTIEYIKEKLESADLYTHLYMPKTAYEMENECLVQLEEPKFCNEQILRIRAYNWTAFDSSKCWEYNIAYDLGRKGLKYTNCVIQEMVEYIKRDIPNDLLEALTWIMRVYNNEVDLVDEKSFLNSLYDENNKKDKLPIKKLEEYFYKIKEHCRKCKETSGINPISYKLSELIELFEGQYLKLRSNFPWYCIKSECGTGTIDVVGYGINTYHIRKCIFRTNQKLGSPKSYDALVLRSFENIAKYMFKVKNMREYSQIKLDNAILLLKEATQKRSYTMHVVGDKNKFEREQRKEEILSVKIGEEMRGNDNENGNTQGGGVSTLDTINKMCMHCKYLYDEFCFTENIWDLSYEEVEGLELYSYLGDMYIEKEWFYEALEEFAFVILQNYVCNRIYTSLTMDAYCRASIALCGLNLYNPAKEFIEVVCSLSEDGRIQCPERKRDEFRKVREGINRNASASEIHKLLT